MSVSNADVVYSIFLNGGIIWYPKTRASVRMIRLSDEVFEVLREYMIWQKKQKEDMLGLLM